MGRIIRKRNNEAKLVKPTSIGEVAPEPQVIVKLSTEDTNFCIAFKDDTTVVLLALDGTYETVSIPVSQFNRSKYTFKAEDNKTYTANLTIGTHK